MAKEAWSLTEKDLEDIPPLLGRSDSQKDSYKTALILTEKKYPKFCQLTKEHVEGDSMEDYLEDFSGWFAREQIWTKQNTWLATNGKLNSLGLVKEMLKYKFRDHDLWKSWWTEMRSNFKRAAE